MTSYPHHLRDDQRGTAVLEFALILPVLCLIVALLSDLGIAYHLRLQLTKGVASGTYYLAHSAASLSSSNEASIAQNVVALVQGIAGSSVAVTVLANGVAGPTNADTFYCLNGMTSTGSRGALCADTTTSGKFFTVRASLAYLPIFPLVTSSLTNIAVGETITVRVQ